MKNALIALVVVFMGIMAALVVHNSSVDDSVPSEEPREEKLLYVAQGKFLARDRFGNVQFDASGADETVVFTFDNFDRVLESSRIETGSALALSRGLVEHDGEEVIQNLIGITNDSFPYVFGYSVNQGSFFENGTTEKVVVVGQSLAAELEEKGVADVLGEMLNVRGTNYRIIGVLDTIDTGNAAADADLNKLLLVPREFAVEVVGESVEPFVEEMRFIANNSKTLDKTADEITEILIDARGTEDFSVLRPQDLAALGINVSNSD